MMEAQKCPMCNSDITVPILEKAIEEESTKKKKSPNKFLGIFGRKQKEIHPIVAGANSGADEAVPRSSNNPEPSIVVQPLPDEARNQDANNSNLQL